MGSALLTKEIAIIPHTGVDFTDKEGYLVKENAGALALNDSAVAAARGVILEGADDDEQSSIGILGAFAGTVRVKLGGAVAKYNLLQQKNDGTVEVDAAAGARVLVGIALEAGAAGDLIEAALFAPRLAA
jgi:hypothetical protein